MSEEDISSQRNPTDESIPEYDYVIIGGGE